MAPETRRQRQQQQERDDDDDDVVQETYTFDGKEYDSYIAMVDAKRQRNQQVLMQSGLLQVKEKLQKQSSAIQRGLQTKKRKSSPKAALPRRKSSRLAGVQADGAYVESERSGTFVIRGLSSVRNQNNNDSSEEEDSFFKNRINDGSHISIQDAVELTGPKWVEEDSVALACSLVRDELGTMIETNRTKKKNKIVTNSRSPTSVAAGILQEDTFESSLNKISVDDDECVAKVTPNRIYSVACHPSPDTLIVGAGDKEGHVGLWNVDSSSAENDGVHLFKIHNRPVSCIEWTPSGDAMLSSSYDGTVRWFDVQKERWQQIFAPYDDSVTYRNELGRGLDQGYNYWVQYCTMDHRNPSEQCFFLSTSVGTAMHVDMRAGKRRLAFHEVLSEKKINSVSLHPNGNTLASAGLDCTVRLWDIRMLKNNNSRNNHSRPKPLGTQSFGKSINSAFFSPSGSSLLSTTMANSLEIATDAHLNQGRFKSTKRIPHDNCTGRWLSTFMAKWHPSRDVFVVGSMRRPRTVEVYNDKGSLLRGVQGEALTAVASRCCFHPSQDQMILVGGNSSGRVTVAR